MATASDLKKDFQFLIKNNSLAQGYLFFGASDISFSLELANFLENGDWIKSAAPLLDFMEAGEGIDDMRAGINFLWQKPLKSPRKTLLIPDAENLTLEAQNAILKISEEAPNHALIILLVRNQEVLLPTLRSRLQKIYVHGNDQFLISNFQTNPNFQMSKKFLTATLAKQKEIIKEIIASEDDNVLGDFVAGLLIELRRDKMKNWKVIKELLYRWSMISQFNVNKRLQLEAALL